MHFDREEHDVDRREAREQRAFGMRFDREEHDVDRTLSGCTKVAGLLGSVERCASGAPEAFY